MPASDRSTFRPDVQGLRAVAVLMVLAHHAALPLHGGYAGVDVFFVLSGYLVTGLLLRELWATGGIDWARFAARRVRRLLPAALLVLLLTSAWAFVVVPGLRRREVAGDVTGAAGQLVNWVFARREVDYLAPAGTPSPVQHYWSLAVEEQFYVLWPLLLIGLAAVLRMTRRGVPGRAAVGGVLGAVTAASFGWALWASAARPDSAFFTTTTRVWELGVGALLAVALTGRERPAVPARGSALAGWAGLAALVVVAVGLPPGWAWPAPGALLVVLPTAVVVWAGWQGASSGPVRVLGTRPALWLGGLSYSLYLWHWPAVVLGEWTADRAGWPFPAWAPAALVAASVPVAWASTRWVEDPVRHGALGRVRPRTVLAAGLAGSCAVALATLPLLPLRSPFDTTPPGGRLPPVSALGAGTVTTGLEAVPTDPGWVVPDPLLAGRDRPDADVDHCQVPEPATEPVACTFGDPRGPTTVALVGDSKAMQWLPALQEVADRRGWRVVTWGKSSCPFSAAPAALAGRPYPECDAWNASVRRALDRADPDVVVTSGGATAAWTGAGPSARVLADGYVAAWRTAAAGGARVLVLGDSPRSPDDLDACAARHPRDLDACAFDAGPAVAASGLPAQRAAVARAGEAVRMLDLSGVLCPGARCPVVVGQVAVHRPGSHVTATFARTAAPRVERAVTGLLAG